MTHPNTIASITSALTIRTSSQGSVVVGSYKWKAVPSGTKFGQQQEPVDSNG